MMVYLLIKYIIIMEILKRNELNKKGVLIEYDAGYISPNDNRHFISEVNKLSQGQSIIEEPLVVYAVMHVFIQKTY